MIEDIKRNKWIAIYAFLIMDFIQILIVSLLYLDDANLFVVGINLAQTNPLISAPQQFCNLLNPCRLVRNDLVEYCSDYQKCFKEVLNIIFATIEPQATD